MVCYNYLCGGEIISFRRFKNGYFKGGERSGFKL